MLCSIPLTGLIYYSFDTSSVTGNIVTNLGSGGSAYNGQLDGGPVVSSIDKAVGTGAISLISSH